MIELQRLLCGGFRSDEPFGIYPSVSLQEFSILGLIGSASLIAKACLCLRRDQASVLSCPLSCSEPVHPQLLARRSVLILALSTQLVANDWEPLTASRSTPVSPFEGVSDRPFHLLTEDRCVLSVAVVAS